MKNCRIIALTRDIAQRPSDRHVACFAADAVAGGAQAVREFTEDHRRRRDRHVGLDRMAAIVEPDADDLLWCHDDRGGAQALDRDERTGWRTDLRGKRRDIAQGDGCRSLSKVRGCEILDAAVTNETGSDAF
jgi:hypothetical protein